MNAGIIDSNRFAPYGEPLDPVAKNSRRTNSSFGFTGEAHDIEAGLVYLRARYYEPGTMRFLQQDTVFGDIREPLTRNLYIYANANPLKYVDPSGHRPINDGDVSASAKGNKVTTYNSTGSIGIWIKYGDRGANVVKVQNGLNVWTTIEGKAIDKYLQYLDVDGIFGPKTKESVSAFKNVKGIWNYGRYEGVVDQRTWNELMPYMSGSSSTVLEPKLPSVQGTGNNAVLRALTPAESARWKSSERIKYVPVLSTINNAKIAVTGSDLYVCLATEKCIIRQFFYADDTCQLY